MSTASLDDLRRQLDAMPDGALPSIRFHGADMRQADLSGQEIACISLRGAILNGADLRGSSLSHVDLSGASLDDVRLSGATLNMVSARGTSLRRAAGIQAYLDIVDLTGADLSDSDFREAAFQACVLERTTLDHANLSAARLTNCTCIDASFRRAEWTKANTAGSRFRGADLDGARDFARCRELVAHILDPLIDEGFDVAQLVAVVASGINRCYPEWSEFLTAEPRYRMLAASVFARYPESGIAEALSQELRALDLRSPR